MHRSGYDAVECALNLQHSRNVYDSTVSVGGQGRDKRPSVLWSATIGAHATENQVGMIHAVFAYTLEVCSSACMCICRLRETFEVSCLLAGMGHHRCSAIP